MTLFDGFEAVRFYEENSILVTHDGYPEKPHQHPLYWTPSMR